MVVVPTSMRFAIPSQMSVGTPDQMHRLQHSRGDDLCRGGVDLLVLGEIPDLTMVPELIQDPGVFCFQSFPQTLDRRILLVALQKLVVQLIEAAHLAQGRLLGIGDIDDAANTDIQLFRIPARRLRASMYVVDLPLDQLGGASHEIHPIRDRRPRACTRLGALHREIDGHGVVDPFRPGPELPQLRFLSRQERTIERHQLLELLQSGGLHAEETV